ncbi:MAG: SH3 domain-containing protein, partial [Thermoanaerobaculia bacterium]
SDAFTTPREALLREKPSREARVLAKLPQGSRLTVIESRDRYLRVERKGLPTGWIAREVAVVFPPDVNATRELVIVGRAFSDNDTHRLLAACLLDRAASRLRDAKTPDPEVEVLLGETLEELAATGGPFRAELGVTEKSDATGTRGVYDGSAFQRAADLLGSDTSPASPFRSVRERAQAGLLRVQFRDRPSSLAGLLQESNAWLSLLEVAEEPSVVRSAAEHVGEASLGIGRYLLALGKLEELAKLESRLRAASVRVQSFSPDTPDGRRLASRAAILFAMRGDGSPSFPQEVRIGNGGRERTVRIDGKLGALTLTVDTRAGATRETLPRKAAVPILPVPGSLRISPDGRSVAWIEVAGPSQLVPVMTSLERDEPAREVAFLSSGRPLRDRALAHIVGHLTGFSKDGQRLGLSIEAWNSTPGPSPRYSVVSVATGELLFETSSDMKSFQRLLQ